MTQLSIADRLLAPDWHDPTCPFTNHCYCDDGAPHDKVSHPLAAEAAGTILALVEALKFYADETAWNQPPVKTVAHELLGPAYENQASKVRLDRGRIARAAIAKAGDAP